MVRMMKFKDYFLNKITEILGTYFVLFLMLEFLYIIGNTYDRGGYCHTNNDEIFNGLV